MRWTEDANSAGVSACSDVHLRDCLTMIVRNEQRIITHCLESVAPYIDCWVIGDTGSSDGTLEIIETLFRDRGIPGELHYFSFANFE